MLSNFLLQGSRTAGCLWKTGWKNHGKALENFWKNPPPRSHKSNPGFPHFPTVFPKFSTLFFPEKRLLKFKNFSTAGSIGILWKNPTRKAHLIQPFLFPFNDLTTAARHRIFSGKGWGKTIPKCGKRKKQISGHFSFHRFHRLLS